MCITKVKKIVIWGSGGISREVAFLIEDINQYNKDIKYEILGFIEKDKEKQNTIISGYKILGDYSILDKIDCDGYVLPIGSPTLKLQIFNNEISRINKKLIAYNLIHPSVIIRKKFCNFGVGNIICAGAVLTTDVSLGNFNLINLNCTIGHDVEMGDFNVVNPLTAISGGVRIGNNNLIGTGVKVIQNLSIVDNIVIGAGAVVANNIYESGTYIGIPAKRIIK